MLDDLLPLFSDTVLHQSFSDTDVYGEPLFDAPASHRARISYRSRLVTSPSGERVNSRGTAIIAGVPAVKIRDRLILPDNSAATVVSYEQTSDEGGRLYTTVNFA